MAIKYFYNHDDYVNEKNICVKCSNILVMKEYFIEFQNVYALIMDSYDFDLSQFVKNEGPITIEILEVIKSQLLYQMLNLLTC